MCTADGTPEEAWLAARAGQHGYLSGKDAETSFQTLATHLHYGAGPARRGQR